MLKRLRKDSFQPGPWGLRFRVSGGREVMVVVKPGIPSPYTKGMLCNAQIVRAAVGKNSTVYTSNPKLSTYTLSPKA